MNLNGNLYNTAESEEQSVFHFHFNAQCKLINPNNPIKDESTSVREPGLHQDLQMFPRTRRMDIFL